MVSGGMNERGYPSWAIARVHGMVWGAARERTRRTTPDHADGERRRRMSGKPVSLAIAFASFEPTPLKLQ